MINTLNTWLRKIPAPVIYIVFAIWAAWLFAGALLGQLSSDPIEDLLEEYGEMALKLLVVGLAITPLRDFTGITLIKFRRAIGVTAFFLVLAHFLVWAILDMGTLERIVEGLQKHTYIIVGMIAAILMILLAASSNNFSLRRMGPIKWRKLHRLTYPVVLLACVHYMMLTKGFPEEPLVYLAIIIGLLALRIVARIRSKRAKSK